MKKGLSPVIVTVLLVLLVVTVSSLIFSWAWGFLQDMDVDTGANIPLEALCEDLDFEVVLVGNLSYSI